MKRKRILSWLLSFVMLFLNVGSVLASGSNTVLAAENGVPSDTIEWTTEDFTYVEYSKLLYGCDYTREITIKGMAISGFSETGVNKLAETKELVIPALDPEGNMIVGVAPNAFEGKGITSVQFPTGMMVDYDDKITYKVTKRGNFIIAENAFAGNELKEVILPEGVIACLPNAFDRNQIETVKLPKTIWWIETLAFARNRITTVEFPTTCDFQLEMHGMAFAKNFIKSVRLPDYTEVVNNVVFAWNTGKEPLAENAKETLKTYELNGTTYNAGVVYMYADNAELLSKDRIHHTEKTTASQKSYAQKLVVNDGSASTKNPDLAWTIDDFTVEGTIITGLSETGIAKRATNKHLVIPEINKNWQYITEIAAAQPAGCGLFASEDEKFDTVYLPSQLKKVGDYAFQNSGLKDITFSSRLTTIGIAAFQMNNLSSVILPDTVTTLGNGAFASNPKMERINLSKGLTKISAGAFGCSDGKNWMTKLTSISLHEGIVSIENNAFAGNNFKEIVFPSTIKELGKFAFSTKNYLKTPCTVELNEGLEEIPADAFRNKCISKIVIPSTVTKIHEDAFRKQYSDDSEVIVTKVYVSLETQYKDTINFPVSEYHKIYLLDTSLWTAEDFTYGQQAFDLQNSNENLWVVTGLSEEGADKIDMNSNVIIPEIDPNGNDVQGVGKNALKERGISSVVLPEGVVYIGTSAFEGNELSIVTFPKSVAKIDESAFARNHISALEFAAKTDSTFEVDDSAFAMNQIKVVQLPSNTAKLHKWAFLQNTGMKEIVDGTTEEKKGGLVYVYINAVEIGENIACKNNSTSVVQEVFLEEAPTKMTPWGLDDFTYDQAGTTITGLSDFGKEKIKVNANIVLPEIGPTGEEITALGDGVTTQGIFVYADGGSNYTPEAVIFPNTITKIGAFTFALNAAYTYQSEMNSITFPDRLVEIGNTAFQNSKLVSVSIPDSVTTLGDGAFAGSGKLTSIKLSKNVVNIPKSAFNAGATTDMKLETVVIPEGVESIGNAAFAGTHIEKLTLPKTIMTIEDNAFANHQLTELEIPGSVVSIGKYAFRVIQEGLTKGLVNLTLNEGLVTIGREAFSGNKLTEVDLPSTVVLATTGSSSDYIFGSSSKPASPIVILKVDDLSKVELYNTENVNRISHKVVYDNLVGTGWLAKDFIYNEDTATITGWSESGHAKRLVLKDLVLPEHTPSGKAVQSIGEQAFMIPNDEVTVTKFGVESPNGMDSVLLPETVTKIGKQAFAQNKLTVVDLSNVTSIGERAFYGNKLTKIELHDKVIALGEGAFATNDITELKLSAGVTVIPQGAFSMNIRLDSVIIPDTVTEICATAFAGARLTSLIIPKSVVKIGEKAFHLHHLSELVIPGNVKELGASAFEGTFKATTLRKLVIEEGVEVIGKNAFKEALLETVHFPNSIQTVGETPFMNNKGKGGSGVVEVTTKNEKHLAFSDDTYTVKYLGETLPEEKPEEKPQVKPQIKPQVPPKGTWKLDAVGWWYQNPDGSYPYNSWKKIDNIWYYFNGSGYMVTGWQYIGNVWYYFNGSGAMVTGWQYIGNVWYYFNGSGAMVTGWQYIGNIWYYFNGSGAMVTGWQYIGNVWYYFNGSGAMLTGWAYIGNQWYYFSGSGAMLTGWIQLGNTWYYLFSSGAMAANQWIGNYYVGADGAWRQ